MKRTKIRESRYINEVVGAFLLVAIVIFAASIFLAGKAQGWFEGTIRLEAVFMNAEGLSSEEQGSFDLEAGNEVKIRSTRAGRVQSIEPTADGGMKAIIVVKDRFHRYIKVDSVARVKKKFGLAGDAYVEISGGKGAEIDDDGTIPCYKDEELMEIAQRGLDKLESAIVPMVMETTGVMSNANRIATQISTGDGLVGTLINDPTLTDDVRETVDRMNDLLRVTQEAVSETTRLIKGAQKSWFVRKYIPEDKGRDFISPLYLVYGRADRELTERCEEALGAARISANAAELRRAAYNLSMCRFVSGDINMADLLLQEAQMSGADGGVASMHVDMAAITSSVNSGDKLRGSLGDKILGGKPKGMQWPEYTEFISAAILAIVRDGGISEAKSLCKKFGRVITSKGSEPAKAAYFWSMAEIAAAEKTSEAGALYDSEAGHLAKAELPLGMTESLRRAADWYAASGESEMASLRCLTAGKSLLAQGLDEKGLTLLAKAAVLSQVAGKEALTTYIEAFILSEIPRIAK